MIYGKILMDTYMPDSRKPQLPISYAISQHVFWGTSHHPIGAAMLHFGCRLKRGPRAPVSANRPHNP